MSLVSFIVLVSLLSPAFALQLQLNASVATFCATNPGLFADWIACCAAPTAISQSCTVPVRSGVAQSVHATILISKLAWSYDIQVRPAGGIAFANVFQPIDLAVAQKHNGFLMNGLVDIPNWGFNFSICLGTRIGSCYL